MPAPRDAVCRWRTGFVVLWLGGSLLTSLRAQTPPAQPSAPCPAAALEQALQAQKQAAADEKAVESDKRKPPAGKWKRDYEEVVQSKSNLERARRKELGETKKNLAQAEQELARLKEQHPDFQPIDLAGGSAADAAQRAASDLRDVRWKLNYAAIAKDKFDSDPEIKAAREALAKEQTLLDERVARYMPPGMPPDQILTRLNDTSFRQLDPNDAGDNNRAALRAAKLLEYQNFGDRQEVRDETGLTLRQRLQKAVDATSDPLLRGGNPWNVLRTLGPQLIAEIERCRGEVHLANKPVLASKDAISKRMTAIDPIGAEQAASYDELKRKAQELDARTKKLEAQAEIASAEQVVALCKEAVAGDAQRLADQLNDLAVARKKLADVLAYDALLEPAMKKRKAADDAVEAATKAREADDAAAKAALDKAETDRAAIEKELDEFKTSVLEKKKQIDAETTSDAEARTSRTAKLRVAVKQRKDGAITRIEAIKSSIAAFRRCHEDVEQFAQRLGQRIFELGGPNGASADGFGADLLDVPTDPAAATAPVWVCSKPDVQVRGENPNVSRSASGFTVKQDWGGKQLSGNVSWTGPKGELREGDLVELTINASGDAAVYGWFNVNCDGEWIETDNNAASLPDGKRTGKTHGAGTLKFKFKPGSEPYIQVQAGQEPGTTRWVSVTWKFELKKK